MKYYSPDMMFSRELVEFINCYIEMKNNNYVFDFKKEIIHYGQSDVTLLCRACLTFRSMIFGCGNVCSFNVHSPSVIHWYLHV